MGLDWKVVILSVYEEVGLTCACAMSGRQEDRVMESQCARNASRSLWCSLHLSG